MDPKLRELALNLVNNSVVANIGYLNEENYPVAKAMIMLRHEGLKHFWFFTNINSIKTKRLQINPKASLYFQDFIDHVGLSLLGSVELLSDVKTKEDFWQDSFRSFFSQGAADAELVIVKFTAEKGSYFNSRTDIDFTLE